MSLGTSGWIVLMCSHVR